MQVGCFVGILSITISGLLMMSAGGNPQICVPLAFVIGLIIFALITWIAESCGTSGTPTQATATTGAASVDHSQSGVVKPTSTTLQRATDVNEDGMTAAKKVLAKKRAAMTVKPQEPLGENTTNHAPKAGEFEIRGIDKCDINHSRFEKEFVCDLVRDFQNQYDANTIAVVDESGKRLAFVAKEKAAELAPRMDNGECFRVRIIPNTYCDAKWGCCFVKIENCEKKVEIKHDPRLSRVEKEWFLSMSDADGSFYSIDGALYVTFICNKLLSSDLGLEWKGRKLVAGTKLSKEFVSRMSGSQNGKVLGAPEGVSFSKITKIERTTVGVTDDGKDVVLDARIDGLSSIVYDEEEINVVKINHLSRNMIYHMTDIRNLPNILSNGLLSKRLVEKRGLQQVDIADAEIQGHRDVKSISRGKTLHDYVPFYFNPHNAMLYRVSKKECHNVVILGVTSEAFEGEDYIVSDRNAAARNACFGNSQEFIDGLDWRTIHSESWNDGDDEQNKETKQMMQSEMLIPNAVDAEYIKVIYCKNGTDASAVESMIGSVRSHIAIKILPEMFFEHEYSSYRNTYRRSGYGRRSYYR